MGETEARAGGREDVEATPCAGSLPSRRNPPPLLPRQPKLRGGRFRFRSCGGSSGTAGRMDSPLLAATGEGAGIPAAMREPAAGTATEGAAGTGETPAGTAVAANGVNGSEATPALHFKGSGAHKA